MASAWGDPYEGRATTFVRWVGGATILVSVAVAVSLVARGVDFNPFVLATVLVGLASGLLAVVPYMIGLSEIGGVTDSGVAINLGMHVIGSALVIALVYVPSAHEWLTRSLSRQ